MPSGSLWVNKKGLTRFFDHVHKILETASNYTKARTRAIAWLRAYTVQPGAVGYAWVQKVEKYCDGYDPIKNR